MKTAGGQPPLRQSAGPLLTLQHTPASPRPPALDTTANSELAQGVQMTQSSWALLRRAHVTLCCNRLDLLKFRALDFHYALGRAGYITSPLFPQLLTWCGHTFSALGHPQGP